jgi:hypothetical protein
MSGLVKLQPQDIQFSRGPKTGFVENARAAIDIGRASRWTTELDRVNEAEGAFEAFAEKLVDDGVQLSDGMINRLQSGVWQGDDAFVSELLGEAAAQGVEIPEGVTSAEIEARRSERLAQDSALLAQDMEVTSRATTMGSVGGFMGGLAGEFEDPVNLATIPLALPAKVGLAGVMVFEAAINAGIEGLQTPGRNERLGELGQEPESVVGNMMMGAAFGAILPLGMRAAGVTAQAVVNAPRSIREQVAKFVQNSPNPSTRAASREVMNDVNAEADAVTVETPEAVREHRTRAQEVQQAVQEGRAVNMPDRPLNEGARTDTDGSELIDPRTLLVQPDVFQFKSEIVAEGGVTPKLQGVTEWVPHRAGVAVVYEYSDGSRAIADGHQRTSLANRIMAQDPTQNIRLRAEVFRAEDGYSIDDVRVLAALKNIAESADGMTARMAGDAAKILRIRPEAIADLPNGPGIARAIRLSKLSDDAFDLYINRVIDERFAEQIGLMVDDPTMHLPIARLLERVKPDTTEQAKNIISQALEAPTSRETTSDLFGETEVVESLYIEQAKVLERAMQVMRNDRSVFKTLTDQATRIEGAGTNRLDKATNAEARETIETALAAIKRLAHRAGPISEALRDGAKKYKEDGRLKDAADAVAQAVRREVERSGLDGLATGPSGRNVEPTGTGQAAPDPHEGFSDPVGEAAQAQIRQTRIEPTDESAQTQALAIQDLKAMPISERVSLEADLKSAQNMTSIDDLMIRGEANHVELTQLIAAFAQEAGVTPRAAPLKGRERTQEKVDAKYAGDYNRVTDVARGGVDAKTPEAANDFVRILSERYQILDEGWNTVEGGYFDRKLAVIFDDGQIGEVQIWVPGMFEVKKNKGHALYSIARDATKTDAERAKARSQMEDLYLGIRNGLDPEWLEVLDQAGSAAPIASRTDANVASSTSGDPSSSRTSAGSMADQDLSAPSKSMDPGSLDTAGIDLSTRKNVMGGPSNTDIGDAGRDINSETTPAGQQTLMAGVDPITSRERLEAAQAAPKAGGSAGNDTQIGGLFDPADPSRFDLFDQVPTGREIDPDGLEVATTRSRSDVATELDADDEFVEQLGACLK